MEEFIKSIKAHLYERTTSPLSGAFIMSWLLWNYKLVFVLFSSMDVDEKFRYAETFLYPNAEKCLYYGVLFPLLTVGFLIFIYPYPAKFVYRFWRNRQKELKKIKQIIEDETPLTNEESKAIRKDLVNLQLEFENELDRREKEIKRLKEIISENENISKKSKLSEDLSDEELSEIIKRKKTDFKLNDEMLNLLEFIGEEDHKYDKDILQFSKTGKVKTEYNLGELENLFLVESDYSEKGKWYSLTHKGRKAVVEAERS